MKRIGLIDVDGGKTFPNLALMKISAWHKSKGHEVLWYTPFDGHFDEVYMSKVFSFTPDYDFYIDADIIHRGGDRLLHRSGGWQGGLSQGKGHRTPI